MKSITTTPKSRGTSGSNVPRLPTKIDRGTGKEVPIRPEDHRGYVCKNGGDEKAWMTCGWKYCKNLVADLPEEQQEKVIRRGVYYVWRLGSDKVENLTLRPTTLRMTLRNGVKQAKEELTPITPLEPVNQYAQKQVKRPGVIRTLATVAAMAAAGTILGVAGHDAYQAWSNGREYNPTQRLNEIVSIFKEAK